MNKSARYLHAWVCGALLLSSFTLSAQGNGVLRSLPLKATQGVAVDARHVYAISNTEIRKHDKGTGKEIAVWKADTKREGFGHFLHINSGTAIGGRLYCAHSRYPIAPNDCTVEIFDVSGKKLEHAASISMPSEHGSLTWIDRRKDGSWWMCYAVYGVGKNKGTKLLRYRHGDGKFIEETAYAFPQEVVAKWGAMSCSGGSWGPDDLLYVTGHDLAEAYVLRIEGGNLEHVRTEANLGFHGQAIAWDRFSDEPALWGIVKSKSLSLTRIPGALGKSE